MSLSSVASSVVEALTKRHGTGETITVVDPATEERITEFPDAGPEAVNAAVGLAPVERDGVTLLCDPLSLQYLGGAEIDYSESLQGAQFVIRNPNAKTTCGCGSSFTV